MEASQLIDLSLLLWATAEMFSMKRGSSEYKENLGKKQASKAWSRIDCQMDNAKFGKKD